MSNQLQFVSPLVHVMRDVPWQAFLHLTFKNPIPVEHEARALVGCIWRKACRMTRTHVEACWFLCRGEFGELGGRFHYHMLVGNLKPPAGTVGFCMDLKRYWSKLRFNVGSFAGVQGDISQVWPYDSTLDGVDYIMKGLTRYEFASEACNYELTKFGFTDQVTLSNALLRHVTERVRRGGLK